MNVKKFAQDKAKKLKYDKYIKQNKQNLCSVDDSKFKQFSVDLHKLSMDQDIIKRKSIIKQDISVFLQSQQKTYQQVNRIQSQLSLLINKLQQSQCSLSQFMRHQVESQYKNEEINRLLKVLYKKSTLYSYSTLQSTKITKRSIQQSKLLAENVVSPYLKEDLNKMTKQLQELKMNNQQIGKIRNTDKMQKQYIRHTLQNVYKRQLKQVQELQLNQT